MLLEDQGACSISYGPQMKKSSVQSLSLKLRPLRAAVLGVTSKVSANTLHVGFTAASYVFIMRTNGIMRPPDTSGKTQYLKWEISSLSDKLC